ncbi:hypothetical protein CVIRNUC_002134 [Coccomyxa viridis]|uniref:A-kinase anchor protein 7-like phosphoesterase domain-containing protein n=1 Tax=Coccomyxa viridis TaxID=1274662 RepID=A0AAV1HY66_9CHLO|nr:hypothetical protein CVIRNUC_002134 [Coccomyxa viridis]
MLLPALSPTLGSFHRVSWHCFLQHGPAKAPLSSSSMGSLHSLAAMYSQEDELTHGRSGAANAIRTTGDNGDRQDRRPKRSRAVPNTDETRQRPTHFIAAQVSHESNVIQAIQEVQKALVGHTAGLKDTLVEPATAHFTLMVMPLRGGEEKDRGYAALRSLGAAMEQKSLLAPVSLELQGLSHFRHQVLYLDVAPAQDGLGRLKAVAAAAREHFLSQGLGSCDQRPFTPHVTIAKLSNLKSYAARRSINTIPEAAYQKHFNIQAGSARILALQLCAMQYI